MRRVAFARKLRVERLEDNFASVHLVGRFAVERYAI